MKIVCLFKYVLHCQLCHQIHFFVVVAVYLLRYATHLGSLGSNKEARVAVLLCSPKIMSVPQVDGCYHQLCCLFS